MKNINIGKIFEANIKKSCPNWLFVHRPPDAAQSYDMGSKLRFSQHSPADFFFFDGERGFFFVIECKTFDGSCSFERNKTENGIIHYHQVVSLTNSSKFKNVISGFFLDFRKSGNTYFLPISGYFNILNNIQKKSFNETDLLNYGNPIIIEKKKKKVNYQYNIEKFILDSEDTYDWARNRALHSCT